MKPTQFELFFHNNIVGRESWSNISFNLLLQFWSALDYNPEDVREIEWTRPKKKYRIGSVNLRAYIFYKEMHKIIKRFSESENTDKIVWQAIFGTK